jgi:hypothetical protein
MTSRSTAHRREDEHVRDLFVLMASYNLLTLVPVEEQV